MAGALEQAAGKLVPIAQAETALGEDRLRAELARTTFQLRILAEEVTLGLHLDVRIDSADPDWPMGVPRPDLRRGARPLGPVLVFAAGNFPFAFSVAGGDVASALVAGCPVVIKAHPGHPLLSAATFRVLRDAVLACGAPDGVVSLIHGQEAGRAAVVHPAIRAVAFTGSHTAGRQLFDLACSRTDPVPFFGELGSTNPVFVTRGAARTRAAQLRSGFVASFTLGTGQFCTKPGLLLVPSDSEIPDLLAETPLPGAAPMLNAATEAGFLRAREELAARTRPLSESVHGEGAAPSLHLVDASDLLADLPRLGREYFGPVALVVRWQDEQEMLAVAEAMEGQLTASIHGDPDEPVVPRLVRALSDRAGRILWNQWPTGVAVTHAQHHGGPYPASTTPGTTSVGTASIGRFLRPVAYQGFPDELLDDELKDEPEEPLARRVDGVLRPAPAPAACC